MGVPIATTYTDEERERIIDHVLVELCCGRPISRTLREDDEMPSSSTFWRWHMADAELREKVACARENGVESIMDETLDIADDKVFDTVKDESGQERANTEWISRSRLRVDTRHKYAQMIAPRKYGAKLDVTSGGEKLNEAADPTSVAVKAAAMIRQALERDEPE